MQNTPRACIFDLDGTLIDSLADLADAANASLAAAGYPEHPCDAYRTFVGNGITVLIQRALPPDAAQGMAPQALQQIVDHMSRIYADNWHAKTLCYAGIPELVARLHRQNIALAVLSNKPHSFTCEIVDYYFPSKPFRLVYGARPGYPHKPDPAMALHLAQELNFPPLTSPLRAIAMWTSAPEFVPVCPPSAYAGDFAPEKNLSAQGPLFLLNSLMT